MTQTSQLQVSNYSCECLVNSKIPLNLFTKLESRLRRHLHSNLPQPLPSAPSDQLALLQGDEVLAATIESLHITEEPQEEEHEGEECDVNSNDIDQISSKKSIKVYLYKYPETEEANISKSPSNTRSISLADSESDTSSLYTLETFPSTAYTALWDSLQFDSTVKASILAYITAIFKFSMLGLTRSDEISFNRILLLHGPPGTGKTTLAKALVFKLSTRLYSLQRNDIPKTPESSSDSVPLYDRLQCLTIHSNQLFSRFFSESAKSVQRLFELIKTLAMQPGNFVCVLIDEVESLAMSRKQSADSGSSEPTDSIRAVNTLLTQIDQLRSLPNILYITTSNFPSLVDSAFIDRVDWSFHVALPSERVIYALMLASIRAMKAKGLVRGADELASTAQAAQLIGGPSLDLLELCKSLVGQSGRAVKRLPLMTYAAFMQKHPNSHFITISQFITHLKDLITKLL